MSTMIECQGLTKRFGTFTAVDHVTFSVGKGSIFGFLGPNGPGKSTVIRMLCGILEPTEGIARIGGHDVVQDAEPIKDMIGYMFPPGNFVGDEGESNKQPWMPYEDTGANGGHDRFGYGRINAGNAVQ